MGSWLYCLKKRRQEKCRFNNRCGPKLRYTGSAYKPIPEEMYSTTPTSARARVSPFSDPEPGGLEASLLQLVNDHQQSSLRLRELAEKAKKDAIRNASRVSDLLVDAVNGGVQECFINEKRIELETRALAATISRFAKQTDQWLAASHALNNAVKEIGDFENWMKTMEFDCKNVVAAIHNIHQE